MATCGAMLVTFGHSLGTLVDLRGASRPESPPETQRAFSLRCLPGENKFAFDGRALGAADALDSAMHTHERWRALATGETKCDFKGTPCWVRAEE